MMNLMDRLRPSAPAAPDTLDVFDVLVGLGLGSRSESDATVWWHRNEPDVRVLYTHGAASALVVNRAADFEVDVDLVAPNGLLALQGAVVWARG